MRFSPFVDTGKLLTGKSLSQGYLRAFKRRKRENHDLVDPHYVAVSKLTFDLIATAEAL